MVLIIFVRREGTRMGPVKWVQTSMRVSKTGWRWIWIRRGIRDPLDPWSTCMACVNSFIRDLVFSIMHVFKWWLMKDFFSNFRVSVNYVKIYYVCFHQDLFDIKAYVWQTLHRSKLCSIEDRERFFEILLTMKIDQILS